MALRRTGAVFGSWLRPTTTEREELFGRLLPVDVEIAPDRIVLRAHLPGFTPDQIDVRASLRAVTISTHRTVEETSQQRVRHEVYRGNWYRRIRLRHAVRPDLASVSYENGELTICLPRLTPARSIVLKLPGAQVFEHPEIPLRSSVDLAEPAPGPTDTVFKP